MLIFTAVVIGILFSCAAFLVLQKNILHILFGFGLLTHAANLAILAMSKNPTGKISPIVASTTGNYADPLPQALILTAIVIGFGVTAFLVVLIYRLFKASGSTDVDTIYKEKESN